MTEEKNLWPKIDVEQIVLPKSLMAEQANFLSDMTNRNIIGQISSFKTSDNRLIHEFRLVVPALDNYVYTLFTVQHKMLFLYPLKVNTDIKAFEATKEEDFKQIMKEIFNSEATKKVVSSILSQVVATPAKENDDSLPF